MDSSPAHSRARIESTDQLASPAEQILNTLWTRRVTFAVAFLSTLAAIAAGTFSLPKIYSTHTFLLVSPTKQTGSQFAATELIDTLTKTYAELIQSPQVADSVAAVLPFERSRESLESAVDVSPVSGSQLLRIGAEAGSPAEAQTIADTFAQVFVERVKEAGAAELAPAELAVAESAFLPRSPSRPKPLLYLVVGSVFALMVAVGVTLLRERLSQRLELDSSTTEMFGLPVIGRIPKSRALGLALTAPSRLNTGLLTEPFRLLHANISFVASTRRPLALAVVSPALDEGKSICAANLARVTTELETSVLLVDADVRLQTLSSEVGVAYRSPGFSSLLAEGDTVTPISQVVHQKPGTQIHLLPAGPPTSNPTALLASTGLARLRDRISDEFDFVIYDCPPLGIGADASLLAAAVDGVLLVVDAESTRRKAALQAVDQLRRASANVLGVVINRTPGTSRSSPYHWNPGAAPARGPGHASLRGPQHESGGGDARREARPRAEPDFRG